MAPSRKENKSLEVFRKALSQQQVDAVNGKLNLVGHWAFHYDIKAKKKFFYLSDFADDAKRIGMSCVEIFHSII